MEEQKQFKVGDRVRVKNPDWERHFDCGNDIGVLTNEDIGVVKGDASYWNGLIEVSFLDGFVCLDFSEDELELVASYDPKTDFLSELKGLLSKYNASFSLCAKGSYCGDDVESITLSICVGEDCVDYTTEDFFNYEISADNIMDYDKE